jgi:hypothetical protein
VEAAGFSAGFSSWALASLTGAEADVGAGEGFLLSTGLELDC